MTDLQLHNHPWVAFVGAGASAVPPSNLPGWTQFNTLVLEELCQRLNEFSGNRQPTEAILHHLHARRDETRFLTPDLQAQLMEEEVGLQYFSVWQSLGSAPVGPVHRGLAELGARGQLSAIVTTNFDHLLETALAQRGVPFQVAHDSASFDRLCTAAELTPLPLLKIHGSLEDPASMVDTLRQRLAGRPPALQALVDKLLRGHRWLYLGFSGADFTHVPNYLNVLGLAAEARGFVFLARPGVALQPGVERIKLAYGADKAEIAKGELPDWLHDAFDLPAETSFETTFDTVAAVRNGVRRWAAELGPMAVVNIVFAMLKSCGLDHEAFWLLRKTWRSYRAGQDTKGPSYDRYNHNYGLALLEAGFLRNPISLAADMSNHGEWKAAADQNAFEYLMRSYRASRRPSVGAALARLLALRGEIGQAIQVGAQVVADADALGASLEFCDVAIECTGIFDVIQMYSGPVTQLRRAHEIAANLGDEPRRARLATLLGRFLSYAGDTDEAAVWLDVAEEIATRYDLQPVLREAMAARGIWHAESGRPAEALALLEPLAEVLRTRDAEPLFMRVELGQVAPSAEEKIRAVSPLRARVSLDLARAAMLASDAARMTAVFDELDILATEVFPGYCAQYYHFYAAALIQHGEGEQSRQIQDLIDRLEKLGDQQGNPWAPQAAQVLRSHWLPPAATTFEE